MKTNPVNPHTHGQGVRVGNHDDEAGDGRWEIMVKREWLGRVEPGRDGEVTDNMNAECFMLHPISADNHNHHFTFLVYVAFQPYELYD